MKLGTLDLKVDLRKVLIAIIIIGIILRVVAFFVIAAGDDAGYYVMRGKSVADGKGFYNPFGDSTRSPDLEPTHSSTLSKTPYSVYLAAYYYLFDSSYLVSKIATVILSCIALFVVYYCSKDLFDKDKALIIMAVFSLDGILILWGARIQAEDLVFLLFTLTLWSLLKSVKDQRYIPVSIILISIFLLSKVYVWYIYLPCIVTLYLWLYSFRKRAIFKDLWFYLSIVAVVLFMTLNYLYESSITDPTPSGGGMSAFLETPIEKVLIAFLIMFVFCLVYVTALCLFFLKPIKTSIYQWKNPLNNICLLAILGLMLFTSFIITHMHIAYGQDLIWKCRLKYLQLTILPIVWLAVRNHDYNIHKRIKFNIKKPFKRLVSTLKSREGIFGLIILGIGLLLTRRFFLLTILIFSYVSLVFRSPEYKLLIFGIMLLVISLDSATGVWCSYKKEVGLDLNERMEDGDTIAFDAVLYNESDWHGRIERYSLAPYLESDYVLIDYAPNTTADYILSVNLERQYDNYTIVKKYYNYDRRGILSIAVETLLQPEWKAQVVYILWERADD
jgi:hypothetical protein